MTQKQFDMSGDEGGDKAFRRHAASRKSERLEELSNAQFTIRKVRFDQPRGHSRSPRAGWTFGPVPSTPVTLTALNNPSNS